MLNVFTYWGQGIDNIPPFYKIIYKHNLKISNIFNLDFIILDDDNLNNYITINDHFLNLDYKSKSSLLR